MPRTVGHFLELLGALAMMIPTMLRPIWLKTEREMAENKYLSAPTSMNPYSLVWTQGESHHLVFEMV